jgi:hypothetical protein
MAQLAALASALLRSTNAPDAGPYAANGKTQMGEFFGERLGKWRAVVREAPNLEPGHSMVNG